MESLLRCRTGSFAVGDTSIALPQENGFSFSSNRTNCFMIDFYTYPGPTSIVKAAEALRHECNRIMVAFYEGTLEKTVLSVLRVLRSGCRIEHRATQPSTAQLLLDGLDWELELLLT